MKKYAEILAEISATYEKKQAADKEIETLSEPLKGLSFREKLEKNGTIQRLSDLNLQIKDMDLTMLYLRNNAKIAAFNKFVPVILEVWNKYAGKVYGPKTKDKIRNEIKERCNCSFYIDNGFCVTPLDANLRNTSYGFVCGTKYENGTHTQMCVDNKIQPLDFSDLELYYIKKDYVENIPEAIVEIRKLEAEAAEKQEELKAICEKFNAMTVEGIGTMSHYHYIYRRL
ncbi:hypothetical protein [Clostridium sp. AF32-12BH]|uniref:hypothetical protein n=1 Tax=Clostridium sp. AF32-12BH TaxID=2292006 RepID=UPI0011C214B6|nr:hypothetical protein [Clostridium sp. AF32-12BH]